MSSKDQMTPEEISTWRSICESPDETRAKWGNLQFDRKLREQVIKMCDKLEQYTGFSVENCKGENGVLSADVGLAFPRAPEDQCKDCALKREVEELKEFRNTRDMVVEIVKTSAYSGADIRSVFADITRFKKSQKELAETEAIEAKSSETENAALKKQIAELQYQQEADTATIGILADVVDVLWEDDSRCEKHGYGDVVAKAKEIVGEKKRLSDASYALVVGLFHPGAWDSKTGIEVRQMLERCGFVKGDIVAEWASS